MLSKNRIHKTAPTGAKEYVGKRLETIDFLDFHALKTRSQLHNKHRKSWVERQAKY